MATLLWLALLLLPVSLWSPSAVRAADGPSAAELSAAYPHLLFHQEEDVLERYALLLWQGLNQARQNPLAVLERLEISWRTAAAVLGDDAWLLHRGLPPLAFDRQLQDAALGHNREMREHLHYSHYSLDGRGPGQRVAATGYPLEAAGETLSALVFYNFVDPERAVRMMLDQILRDELTGQPGVGRHVFSPEFTEVGIALLAESVTIVDGEPYLYLLTVDFARPWSPRPHMVGQAPPATAVFYRDRQGLWDALPLLPGGAFQVRLTDGRPVELMTVGPEGRVKVQPPINFPATSEERNFFANLSPRP